MVSAIASTTMAVAVGEHRDEAARRASGVAALERPPQGRRAGQVDGRWPDRRQLGHVGSSGRWPAPLGQGPSPLRHSPGVVESSAQQHLDVGIEAAELIGRPLGQGIVDAGIDPQQYLLAVIHRSRVEGAGVDHWRSRLVSAEYDHQIAHHRRFALLVKVDDAALTQPLERHLNHPDRAVDDT